MSNKFFLERIKSLTDEKLIALLQATKRTSNSAIFELAKAEAEQRNIRFESADAMVIETVNDQTVDLARLKRWNWAALLLAPVWALANGLGMWWCVLCFVPVVNIVVILYLAYAGNKLAFQKSTVKSVDEFLALQEYWILAAIKLLAFGMAIGFVASVSSWFY